MTTIPRGRLAHTAYHEAGHAIVAWALGHTVEYATIRPDPPHPDFFGHVRIGRVPARGVRRFEELAIVFMAGMAAQRVVAPHSPVRAGGGYDRSEVCGWGSVLCAGPGEPDATPDAVSAFERSAARQARRLVLAHWWPVHRLALALLESDRLSGFAMARIAAEAEAEWQQLARYHPGRSAVDHMQEERKALRLARPPRRSDLAAAALTAAAAGAADVGAAATAALVARGFDEGAVRALWTRATAQPERITR